MITKIGKTSLATEFERILADVERNEERKEAVTRERRRKEAQRGYLGTNVSALAKMVHKHLLKRSANELLTNEELANALDFAPARIAVAIEQLQEARLVKVSRRMTDNKRILDPFTDRARDALELLAGE